MANGINILIPIIAVVIALVIAVPVAWLRDNSSVVAATGQNERYFSSREQMDFVNGFPRCDMVSFRSHREDGRANCGQADRAAVNAIFPFRQIVVQEQPGQIFAVHGIGHPRAIRVPGHQVVHRFPFAHQIGFKDVRPEQIVRP